jgi:hypothetical protein
MAFSPFWRKVNWITNIFLTTGPFHEFLMKYGWLVFKIAIAWKNILQVLSTR